MALNKQITQDDIAQMAHRIAEVAHPVKIILFGSRARGNARPDSDIDLWVIERDPVSHRRESTNVRKR